MSKTITAATHPITLAWVVAGAREAGMRVPTPRYLEGATKHLAKWASLTTAARAAAEKRINDEAAEGIPFPPVYQTAENYREKTLESAAKDSVRGIWTPDERGAWRATPEAVLAEWAIKREAIEAAIR
jgi:hypothetical protein